MDIGKIKKFYKEYEGKSEAILASYGEKDGFIIDGEYWWIYYKNLISSTIEKINKNKFSEKDARYFYKHFGFGPKLYNNTFIENGLDKIANLFHYLIDDDIPAESKIREIAEDPESDHFIKGIGINFVTLFLVSMFPQKYAQWNQPIDEALKTLGLYPAKIKGEKKSNLYLRINDICLKLANELKIDSLPVMDNFLYSLSKGYIGDNSLTPPEPPPDSSKIDDHETPEKNTDKHTEMMFYLVKIGLNKGYDVWVATNDKGKEYMGEKFSELCLNKLPDFTQPLTLNTAQFIDVIWFKKNATYPVRFFEIEHSTSVYSGLLRLNDVRIDYPIGRATIVIPQERMNLFDKQIGRRTFNYSGLAEVTDCLTYKDLMKWHKAVMAAGEFD